MIKSFKKERVMDRIRVFLWLVALFNLSVAVFQQSILSGLAALICAVAAIIAPPHSELFERPRSSKREQVIFDEGCC